MSRSLALVLCLSFIALPCYSSDRSPLWSYLVTGFKGCGAVTAGYFAALSAFSFTKGAYDFCTNTHKKPLWERTKREVPPLIAVAALGVTCGYLSYYSAQSALHE